MWEFSLISGRDTLGPREGEGGVAVSPKFFKKNYSIYNSIIIILSNLIFSKNIYELPSHTPHPQFLDFIFRTFCMHDFHKKNKKQTQYFYNNFTIMYKCQLSKKKSDISDGPR